MSGAHQRNLRIVGLVLLGGVTVGLVIIRGGGNQCADITRLVAESANAFEHIQGELIDEASGEWSTSYLIDEDSSCSIFIDIEGALYLCEWEHSAASNDGLTRYDSEVERVTGCLSPVDGRNDSAVNHPDEWVSTRFAIPSGDVTVSRKAKNERGAVVVTVGVDAEARAG